MNDCFNNYFSSIDLHLGNFIASFNEDGKEESLLAAALLSRSLRDGHVCLDLKTLAGTIVYKSEDEKEIIQCRQLDLWLNSLGKSPCVGRPGDFKPLILDEKNRLYLQRYWQYEKDVAGFILARASVNNEFNYDGLHVQEKLNKYFNKDENENISWQKVAAATALLKKFLIISGRPGTGKTTTVTKIMAFLLEMKESNMRIALAAPTGKAAARLQESVKKTKERLNCSDVLKEMIPETASTIHRLLGSISGSPFFRFNEKNKLPFDLIIVDEASMIDLPLMAKLMAAISDNASLILLGDHNQLASVDAGVVLGDICGNFKASIYWADFCESIKTMTGESIIAGNISPGVQDCILQLQQNYRFAEQSGIGVLSRAVEEGSVNEALNLLQSEKYPDISWTNIEDEKNVRRLRTIIIDKYKDYLTAVNAGFTGDEKVFDLFDRFRILCALRVGSWGTERINSYIEKILADEGLINPRSAYYEGRPVMVVQNDYGLNLFNGDVGIILKDRDDNNHQKVFFRDNKGSIRKILPVRLPQHETVWAMTVHKSQGSEFEEVMLILSDREIPVITRELLYTGITRAVSRVNIQAGKEILNKAITRRVSRRSGLADTLTG
ncbi:MAG: exodeoxyribonuclease V subunit alpha [Smithella sp.]